MHGIARLCSTDACGAPFAPGRGMAGRDDVRHDEGWRGALPQGVSPGEFFSLGGLLAPYAPSRASIAPWLLTAAVLVALASWDPLTRGGRFDAVLLGLAAYELLIALTRTTDNGRVSRLAEERSR
jgi:hypothetical protein